MAIGKISSIVPTADPKVQNMTNSLAAKGKSRYPGTGVYYFPKKDISGRYLTGLDENAPELLKEFPDEKELKAKKKEIKERRERLERATGLDLSSRSSFWNYSLYTSRDLAHIQPVRLHEGENTFNFANALEEINFYFLRYCDDIAVSYESYVRGDKGPGVRFYVHDEDVESKRIFDRKKRINEASAVNESLSPDKRKKIAILMDIPIADNTLETTVYNLIDDKIKESEYKSGKFRGSSPLNLFLSLTELEAKELNTRFLVEEALKYNVYRVRAGGGIYEGERKVSDNKDEMLKFLMDDNHQEDRIALEKTLKNKKLIVV